MEIKSLSIKTDLVFNRFNGTVEDKEDYVVIKTPSNPSYHWGNYLINKQPPSNEHYSEWIENFRSEFSWNDAINHIVFTWDEQRPPASWDLFKEHGFELEKSTVLVAEHLVEPPKCNSAIQVRRILSNDDWESAMKNQLSINDKYEATSFESFKREQMKNYRKMAEANLGNWYGAFIGDRLVGDLGIYHEDHIGRFQSVETHVDYRNQGICRTLVYKAALMAREEFNIEQFVMVADASYHAARVYEMVGFVPSEEAYSLYYWKNSDGNC